ncbi:MAG: ABC transporter transmembrane domain-containing protein, partial [Gammaproteobacteria bacterium]|nr:ABC transporter transmembrane domain-containing protein [Gammaproteobacteria bacterium]
MNNRSGKQSHLQLYRRILACAWPYKKFFLISVVGLIIISATAAGFSALMKPLMDEGFIQRDPATIRMVPVLIVLIIFARGIGMFISQYATAWIGRRVAFDLRNDIFRHMLYLPSRYFESSSTGIQIARISNMVEQITFGVTQVPYTVIGDGLTIVALTGWLLYLNWKLTLIFALMFPVTTLLMRAMNRRFFKYTLEMQKYMGSIMQIVREAIDGQRVIKAFGGHAVEFNSFRESNENHRRMALRKVTVSAI